MSKIAANLSQLIGNTPLMELANFSRKNKLSARLIAKLEYFNPTGSIKDRIAKSMLDDAETKGLVKRERSLLNPQAAIRA